MAGYADALGAKARNGYSAFVRQDLIGADYGLLDCATALPLPDYFTALLFSGYLLYNTQLMMGGDKSRQVRPDEWLLAAVSIYTDVINLFMAILEIMNSQEQRR